MTDILSVRELEAVDYACLNPVWALTTGRSGTMWLTGLLNQCEGLRACHEPMPTLYNLTRKEAEGNMGGMSDFAWRELLRALRRIAVVTARTHNTRYVEVTMLLSAIAPHLLAAFPGSSFLHVSRDPRAFAMSAAARTWCAPGRQDYWFPTPPGGWGYVDKRTPGNPLVARNLWLWANVHRKALAFQDEHPDKVYHARIEDLWDSFDAVSGLLSWLGVPPHVVSRMPHLVAESQQTPKNKGRPLDWDPAWDKAVDRLCGEVAGRLGYT